MSQEDTEALLQQCMIGRLATVGADNVPYITPFNYYYEPHSKRIYVHHSNKPGHLLDNLRHSDNVCFEVEETGPISFTGQRACSASQIYQSVICFGKISAIEAEEEKESVVRLLMKKYIDEPMPERTYSPELVTLDRIVVLAIDVEIMTGKRR